MGTRALGCRVVVVARDWLVLKSATSPVFQRVEDNGKGLLCSSFHAEYGNEGGIFLIGHCVMSFSYKAISHLKGLARSFFFQRRRDCVMRDTHIGN